MGIRHERPGAPPVAPVFGAMDSDVLGLALVGHLKVVHP